MAQPYFNKSKIRRIIVLVSLLASVLILASWAMKEAKILQLDWSFTLPVISFIAAMIPIGSSTVDWFEKRMTLLDSRLDVIEPVVLSLKELGLSSKSEHDELRRILLRQEASIEYLKGTIGRTDLPSVLSQNQKLLEKLKKVIDDDQT